MPAPFAGSEPGVDDIPMRILMLATQIGGRGGIQYAGRLVSRALRDWAGDAADLTFVSLHDGADDLSGRDVMGTAVAGGGSRLKTAWKTWQLLRTQRWDLVLLGHLHLAPLLVLAGTSSIPPVVGMIYGIEAWQPISGLRRRGLLQTQRLLYISQHTRSQCEAVNPWLKDVPGEVCYLGLLSDSDCFHSPMPPPGCEQGRFAVALGRMDRAERYKGFVELIRIWPRVERVRPGTKLVLIGDGNDRSRLQGLAAELRAPVVFTGSVDDDVRDGDLRNCAALRLPSRGEGFGLVYLEAMRLCKPVLAGSTDAGREVVSDGQTGRAVSGQNPEELLAGILDVLGERGSMFGVAGRRRYLEHFCYSRFYERFTGQLEQAVGSAGRTRTLVNAATSG